MRTTLTLELGWDSGTIVDDIQVEVDVGLESAYYIEALYIKQTQYDENRLLRITTRVLRPTDAAKTTLGIVLWKAAEAELARRTYDLDIQWADHLAELKIQAAEDRAMSYRQ